VPEQRRQGASIALGDSAWHHTPMSAGKPKRQSRPKGRGRGVYTMPKWKAMLMLAVLGPLFLFFAGLICWTQAPAVVRCERRPEGKVDVTVERRVLGLHTISTETVPDVINAFSVRVAGATKSGQGSSFSQNVLKLTPRNGPERRASGVASQLTRPKAMARQIDAFIKESSDPSLTLWYVPWLLHVLAVPLVFVGLLLLFALGEALLRTLGFLKPASVPES
jgi:hypothetical protein